MKQRSVFLVLFLTQAAVVFAEVLFLRKAEGQSTDFSCLPGGPARPVAGFRLSHLYPVGPGQQAQAILLSVGEGSDPGLGLEPRGRLVVASGGLGDGWVNLTLTGLQPGDTGLYTMELTCSATGNSSGCGLLTCPQVLLWVDGTDRQCHQCNSKYMPLLYSIFTATVLLLVLSTWLARESWMRARRGRRPHLPHIIYEEMSRKSERCGAGGDDPPGPPHPEDAGETASPIYANHGVQQAEDNYYSCPRQIMRPVLL